jgi:hypothetical protein
LLGIANGAVDIEIALLQAIGGHHLDREVDYCASPRSVSATSATIILNTASSWWSEGIFTLSS